MEHSLHPSKQCLAELISEGACESFLEDFEFTLQSSSKLKGLQIVPRELTTKLFLNVLLDGFLIQVREVHSKCHAAENDAGHVNVVRAHMMVVVSLVATLGRRARKPLGFGDLLLRVVPPPHQLSNQLVSCGLAGGPPQIVGLVREVHRETEIRPPGGEALVVSARAALMFHQNVVWLHVPHQHPLVGDVVQALEQLDHHLLRMGLVGVLLEEAGLDVFSEVDAVS
mmetsp:Transcript_4807/g.9042  ORF Transcript_4807/g.9042 Transcript_4807/m.9042 type:complete len:226 (+) Transcript_4807:426-1103(+)